MKIKSALSVTSALGLFALAAPVEGLGVLGAGEEGHA